MFEEYVPICFAVKKCDGIHGRKKFQKIFYLSKEADIPIHEIFRWNIFGPFSKELASQIDSLCKMEFISEESIGVEHVYKITEKGNYFLEKSLPKENQTYNRFAKVLEILNCHDSQELEKIASIRFLLNEGYKYNYIQTFLKYTKRYSHNETNKGNELLIELLKKLKEL